jgi:hypothetical protein
MAERAIAAIPDMLSEEKRIKCYKEKMKDRRKDLVKVLASRGFSFDSIYKTTGFYGVET